MSDTTTDALVVGAIIFVWLLYKFFGAMDVARPRARGGMRPIPMRPSKAPRLPINPKWIVLGMIILAALLCYLASLASPWAH